jgi:hypothetical protein
MSVSSRISTADAAFSAVKNFYFASRHASGGWSWAYPTLSSVTSMRCRLKASSPPFARELAEGVDFRTKSHAGLDPSKRLVIAPLEGVRMQEKQ